MNSGTKSGLRVGLGKPDRVSRKRGGIVRFFSNPKRSFSICPVKFHFRTNRAWIRLRHLYPQAHGYRSKSLYCLRNIAQLLLRYSLGLLQAVCRRPLYKPRHRPLSRLRYGRRREYFQIANCRISEFGEPR